MKLQVSRTTYYVVLGIVAVLAAAILSIASPPRAYAASAAFVQGRNAQVTKGTTASLAFSKANTAGNLIAVYVVWDNPGTAKVSDTSGNTYTAATARQTWGNNWSAQVFYASNILGGSNTVKVTFGTAITSFGITYLHEYSGLATASPVDVSKSAAGTSASMSSGAATTTQANDLLFAAGASDSSVSKGTGFTSRLTGFGNLTEDRAVVATGSYAGTASQSGSAWAMQLVAFRVASGVTGPPAKLAFVQGPTSTAAGATITPAVKVAVEDANGNVEASDNATKVSLAIGTNPAGGTLSGGAAVTVASGIATFSGLSIDTPGTGYTLTASSTPSFTAATSAAFNVTGAGAPAKLAFVQGPTSTAAGATITPAVKVAVEDANGNVEASDNATKVSLAIGTNPAGGTLSGGAAVTVASGIATFSGLSIDTPGTGYTLTASSTPSFTAATSAAFSITNGTSSDWTTYFQGNDHTGVTDDGGFNRNSAPNLSLAWQAHDAGPTSGVFSQPIVSNGLVYWGSFDGFERATDTSGKLVWQTDLGTTSPPDCNDPSEAGVASTATVTTDVPVGGATSVLYVGGGDAKVYALNAATGAVLWSYQVGPSPDFFVWSSPVVFGNSVYIGVASFGDCPLVQGQLIQLNRVTGALQHTFNVVPNGCTGGGVWDTPTVDAAAGTIYFDTGNPGDCASGETLGPAMVEVRASDLSLVGSWTVPVAQQGFDADFGATPTLFNDVINGQSEPLVGAVNKNGIFYAFQRDALSAGPVWSTKVANGGDSPPDGTGDVATAAFDGTRLYVGGGATPSGCAGSLNALDPATGALIWQHCFTDGFVLGGVTGTSGGVVTVGEGSNIAVLSAASGVSLYSFATAGMVWGTPSIVGNTLYEGDMDGNLYALTTTKETPTAQFVQVNSATPQTSQSTVNVPLSQGQGAGDLNVVAIGFSDTTSTITSVTDSAGNTYQLAAPLTRGSGMSQAIYYAKNINSATPGSNVITVRFSNAVPFADVRVVEYIGPDAVSPLDTSASASGTVAAASSGNLTTSAANELIFGAGYTSGVFTGGTNGFTSRIITPIDEDIAGDKPAVTPGTYAATASQSGAARWVMQAVAFRVG